MSLESQLAALIKKLTAPASIGQVFPDSFIQKHTKEKSVAEWFALADVVDQRSYDAWIASSPDAFVREHSDFKHWDDMYKQAAVILIQARKDKQTISSSLSGDKTFDSIQVDLSRITIG